MGTKTGDENEHGDKNITDPRGNSERQAQTAKENQRTVKAIRKKSIIQKMENLIKKKLNVAIRRFKTIIKPYYGVSDGLV